jgi:ATPase family associated with various cellular activities (AAA)
MTRAKKREKAMTEAEDLSWHDDNAKVMSLGLRWTAALQTEQSAADIASHAAAYATARQRMRDQGQAAAIDQLSLLFRMAPFDEDVLLLALSSQLAGKPKQLTAQVAQTWLGIENNDEALARLWERLAPHAPLRRFQFIETAERPVSTTTPLYIDERVSRYLMGDDAPDRRLVAIVSPVQAAPIPRRNRDALFPLVQAMNQGKHRLVMLIGPRHSGRRVTALLLANTFNLGLVELNARALETAPDLIHVLAREVVMSRVALLVDADQAEGRRLLDGPLRDFATFIIAVAEVRHELAVEMPVLRLEALQTSDRAELWHDALGPHTAEMHGLVASIAEQFKFGPRAIAAIAREGGDLWQACRDRAGRELEELADRIVPIHGWDDIVLPPDVLHDLKAAAAQVRHRTRVYGDHGFAQKYPRGRGISILLAGPSGVGKTMAAEVVAKDLNLDLYRIDLARVVSKYIGETEKNLKAVFDAAELSGAVLLFDEADALFGKRSEVNDSHDRYANIEVSYLLQRMEAYSGLAVLATNMKSHLDPAFLRRLRYVVDVPYPDVAARTLIWQRAFPSAMPRAILDYEALARLEVPGGNIAVIAINAAFLAASEETPLHMGHIARAARAEFRKLDRELRLNWVGGAPHG